VEIHLHVSPEVKISYILAECRAVAASSTSCAAGAGLKPKVSSNVGMDKSRSNWSANAFLWAYRSNNHFNIPPGPRNPVGILWMGLNKRGIGIHGTNSPNTIGRVRPATGVFDSR
jgi:lipoprotein-anchoring transpeptidase ErfK/SrfK